MRLNIAEENSDSQAWEYICILAICIELPSKDNWMDFFHVSFGFQMKSLLCYTLTNGFNYPFFAFLSV